MAKCDEGYICCVCGKDVGKIVDSDLYLRYVIGMLDPEVLHTTNEKHIRCNPTLAQFIVDENFDPVVIDGDFAKANLDDEFVRQREELVTQGWRRLQDLQESGKDVLDYPLPEVIAKIKSDANQND